MVLPFRRKKPDDTSQLYSLLQDAQAGDEQARNQLLELYAPYVLRITSQAARRYIDRERDDEFSIALIAMNEAINSFDLSRRASFLAFAETIIRRRLIDYFRSQRAANRQVPWTQFDIADDEDNVVNYVEVQTSLAVHVQNMEQERRRLEIEEYGEHLQKFDLSFADLVELSPKHADARQNAIQVARLVAADEEMRRYVHERKALPLKLLQDQVDVSRKTLERQRKYILAVVVLLCGDFEQLQAYLT